VSSDAPPKSTPITTRWNTLCLLLWPNKTIPGR